MFKRGCLVLLLIVASACGSSTSPTSPTPTPTPAPTPTTFTLSGLVTDGTSGGILPNIAVQIISAPSQGQATKTDVTGHYSIAGISSGTFNVQFSAVSYVTQNVSVTVSGNTIQNIVLQRTAAAATRVLGITGNTIYFGLPSLDFGTITFNTTKTLSFSFTNSGNAALTISSITKGGWLGDVDRYSVNVTTPLTINPGQTLPVSVTFMPNLDTGICQYETQIHVTSNQTSGDIAGGLTGHAFSPCR